MRASDHDHIACRGHKALHEQSGMPLREIADQRAPKIATISAGLNAAVSPAAKAMASASGGPRFGESAFGSCSSEIRRYAGLSAFVSFLHYFADAGNRRA